MRGHQLRNKEGIFPQGTSLRGILADFSFLFFLSFKTVLTIQEICFEINAGLKISQFPQIHKANVERKTISAIWIYYRPGDPLIVPSSPSQEEDRVSSEAG